MIQIRRIKSDELYPPSFGPGGTRTHDLLQCSFKMSKNDHNSSVGWFEQMCLILGGSSRFVFVFRVIIDELFVSSLISYDKYCGASPCRALKVRSRILYSILCGTGSQWRSINTSSIFLEEGVRVRILATMCSIRCNRLCCPSGSPYKVALQKSILDVTNAWISTVSYVIHFRILPMFLRRKWDALHMAVTWSCIVMVLSPPCFVHMMPVLRVYCRRQSYLEPQNLNVWVAKQGGWLTHITMPSTLNDDWLILQCHPHWKNGFWVMLTLQCHPHGIFTTHCI